MGVTIRELFNDKELELALKALQHYSSFIAGRAKVARRGERCTSWAKGNDLEELSDKIADMADRFRLEMD